MEKKLYMQTHQRLGMPCVLAMLLLVTYINNPCRPTCIVVRRGVCIVTGCMDVRSKHTYMRLIQWWMLWICNVRLCEDGLGVGDWDIVLNASVPPPTPAMDGTTFSKTPALMQVSPRNTRMHTLAHAVHAHTHTHRYQFNTTPQSSSHFMRSCAPHSPSRSP